MRHAIRRIAQKFLVSLFSKSDDLGDFAFGFFLRTSAIQASLMALGLASVLKVAVPTG
ncbi:MAG: hypothetical protein LUD68_03250 [Rikenellaceae bacterium]|nr:hypothetical protein [Rikenellaceae bacterium]